MEISGSRAGLFVGRDLKASSVQPSFSYVSVTG